MYAKGFFRTKYKILNMIPLVSCNILLKMKTTFMMRKQKEQHDQSMKLPFIHNQKLLPSQNIFWSQGT
jgi:hypothetical protein